jgi:hypothetical protein
VRALGHAGEYPQASWATPPRLPFPAATTTVTPAAVAPRDRVVDGLLVPPERLRLATRRTVLLPT